jgi:hypothetical protein
MLVWDLEASSTRELANLMASYLRRGFEIAQIVYSFEDKKPYKAFLINKKELNISNENLKTVELSEDLVKKNIYEIECKVPKNIQSILEKILYGNAKYLLTIDDKEIFFEFVLFVDDKIILKKAFNNKNSKLIEVDINKLKQAICQLVKGFSNA